MITKEWILEHRNTAAGRLVADLLTLEPEHSRLHVQFIEDEYHTTDEAQEITHRVRRFAEELGFEVGESAELTDGFALYTRPRLRLLMKRAGDVWWRRIAEDYDLLRLLSECDVDKLTGSWRVVRDDDSVVVGAVPRPNQME